ncbi:hypothetical protein FQA39_LY03341 [Lamprigera yunnana]|nr:hypothetical protein FQA39_LY03341 [Lamprigera yunnana]
MRCGSSDNFYVMKLSSPEACVTAVFSKESEFFCLETRAVGTDVQVDFHDTQNENKVLEITPGPKLLDIFYNYVSAQDNANTVVSIAPSKPHDMETSTEANFRNEIEPQAVPDSYTTNVDDSPYVEEPFQNSGSSYAPSEEYGSDSTSDAMEKPPDEEQESSRKDVLAQHRLKAGHHFDINKLHKKL